MAAIQFPLSLVGSIRVCSCISRSVTSCPRLESARLGSHLTTV
jgi:hypothetical protein